VAAALAEFLILPSVAVLVGLHEAVTETPTFHFLSGISHHTQRASLGADSDSQDGSIFIATSPEAHAFAARVFVTAECLDLSLERVSR